MSSVLVVKLVLKSIFFSLYCIEEAEEERQIVADRSWPIYKPRSVLLAALASCLPVVSAKSFPHSHSPTVSSRLWEARGRRMCEQNPRTKFYFCLHSPSSSSCSSIFRVCESECCEIAKNNHRYYIAG